MTKPAAPFWRLPWRYWLFIAVCCSMIPLSWLLGKRGGVMAGFDLAVLVFFATVAPFFRHDTAAMRRHAREIDANRTTMLVVTGLVMIVILVVIASDLKQRHAPSPAQLVLIVGTLVIAWLFSNLIYTLHYAYLFYSHGEKGGDQGGLEIPGQPKPDYEDFAYFAFTLGMTFQTSDIDITSPAIRRVALVHCFAAFVFNLGVIAFTINILGSS